MDMQEIASIILKSMLGRTLTKGSMVAADAILAALPDMIAPLVWEYNELRAELTSGAYCIALDGPDPTLFIAWVEDGLPFMFICDAKAAADALNLAAIMAAFNQPKEPT